MKILAIDKYEEPVVKEIENNLKDMQRYVMGHIETITLSETAMLVCNDVGKLADLTPNRILKIGNSHDVIRGDFFICGWSGDEFCDISDDDVEKYTKMFSKPDVLFMPVLAGVSRVCKIHTHTVNSAEYRCCCFPECLIHLYTQKGYGKYVLVRYCQDWIKRRESLYLSLL